MQRSTIWFAIAALWAVITFLSLLHHQWQLALLQAVTALVFLAVALYSRRKEASGRAGAPRSRG
jgi:membrane protein implicated in regulation of membrane protease activity